MPVPGPSLPRAGTVGHCHIPSPKTLHHPSMSGGSTGKDCLPGASNTAGLVLLSMHHMCIAFNFLPVGSVSKLSFSEVFVYEGIGKSRLTGMASILMLHLKSHKWLKIL